MIRWLAIGLAAVAAILVLALIVVMLPPVADHFGYARPIPGGLPRRFVISDIAFTRMRGCVGIGNPGRTYTCQRLNSYHNISTDCSSFDDLRAASRLNISEFGTIPTLLSHPYSVWIWEAPFGGPGPPYFLAFVEDGSCFVIYHRSS